MIPVAIVWYNCIVWVESSKVIQPYPGNSRRPGVIQVKHQFISGSSIKTNSLYKYWLIRRTINRPTDSDWWLQWNHRQRWTYVYSWRASLSGHFFLHRHAMVWGLKNSVTKSLAWLSSWINVIQWMVSFDWHHLFGRGIEPMKSDEYHQNWTDYLSDYLSVLTIILKYFGISFFWHHVWLQ